MIGLIASAHHRWNQPFTGGFFFSFPAFCSRVSSSARTFSSTLHDAPLCFTVLLWGPCLCFCFVGFKIWGLVLGCALRHACLIQRWTPAAAVAAPANVSSATPSPCSALLRPTAPAAMTMAMAMAMAMAAPRRSLGRSSGAWSVRPRGCCSPGGAWPGSPATPAPRGHRPTRLLTALAAAASTGTATSATALPPPTSATSAGAAFHHPFTQRPLMLSHCSAGFTALRDRGVSGECHHPCRGLARAVPLKRPPLPRPPAPAELWGWFTTHADVNVVLSNAADTDHTAMLNHLI